MNYNDKEQKWFLLDGKSKALAEEIMKFSQKQRGKFDKDGLFELNDHLKLFQPVHQTGIANGGPSAMPVWPALFHDAQSGQYYLYSPVDCEDANNFAVPTDGVLIEDPEEHRRLNDHFNGQSPLYYYDGLPQAQTSTAPRP